MGSCRVALFEVVLAVTADDWAFDSCTVAWGGDFATGNDMPRSFPRLATPTPQVKVVRYPEHSLPISMHCPQYGRFRSHLTERFLHAKQSSVAPVAGALLLRFLGAADALLAVLSIFWASAGWVVVVIEAAMLEWLGNELEQGVGCSICEWGGRGREGACACVWYV